MYLHDGTPIVADEIYGRLTRVWPYRSAYDDIPPDEPFVAGDDMEQLRKVDAELKGKLTILVTPLLSNLHNGSIKSWGCPDSDYNEEIAENLFEHIEIDPAQWARGKIHWERSEIDEIIVYSPPRIKRYYSIVIDAMQFWDLFGADSDSNEGFLLENVRRGRKPIYSWEAFYLEAAVRIDQDGLPDKQADFEKQMSEWCENEWGKEPSESTLRDKISKIYNHSWKTKGR
jgi:hypothetical protein